MKQSIPLVNAQRSLVSTGHIEELNDNVLNDKFEYESGKVKSIDDNKVVIELPDGRDIDMYRRTAIQSLNDISIYTEPKVKVGQKVKKGDTITGAVGLEKDTYKSGLNTLVLFHAMFGKVNEDALVVSESYSKRMSHYSIIDLVFNVKNTSAIKWIAPIGTKIKSGDPVITYYAARKLDEVNKALNEKLGGLFGNEIDMTQYTVEESFKTPNNIDEAYVSDVMVQKNEKPKIPKQIKIDFKFSNTSDAVIEEYEKEKNRKIIYDKFPEYIASDTLDPINMNRDDFKVVYTVRVRIIKVTNLMIGSKVTNRYGGKGVISTILPDELMPIMVDKTTGKQHRVEVVMNPYSTISRKIAGVLIEQSLGLIAHRLYDLTEEYKKTKAGQKKIMPLINKYYPGRYDKLTPEEFIKLHESKPIEEVYYFNVGCFSDFTPKKVEEWMEELDIETQSQILMPQTSLTDLDELRENLSPEEFEKVTKDMEGKFIPVDKKLQCGWLTLIELYHIPSYSCKVTTSLFGVDTSYKKDEPILGKGRYRETGQKISEMELWALLSRNSREFIKEARKDTTVEDNQKFLNNLLGLGLTMVNSEGYGLGGSSLREETNKMKTKFRLGKNGNNKK